MTLMHFPFNNITKIVGSALIFMHGFTYVFIKAKENIASATVPLAGSFWATYILFKVMYWSIALQFFYVALLVSLACLVLHIVYKTNFHLGHGLLIGLSVLSIAFSFVHSNRIFYFFQLNDVINSASKEYNYEAWDKYSWFSYLADDKEEAMQANEKAQTALARSIKRDGFNVDFQYMETIEKHKESILAQNWSSFP